jgi:hypothetical protein
MERRYVQRVRAQGTSLLLRWHGKGYEAMLPIRQHDRTHVNQHHITNCQQKIGIDEQIPAGPSREVNAVMTSQQTQQLDWNLYYNTNMEPTTPAFQTPMTTTWQWLSGIRIQGYCLGWEFRFLVPISGTPIESGIPIPFLIPKIPVGKFFSNSAVEKLRNWNSDSKIWNSKKKT